MRIKMVTVGVVTDANIHTTLRATTTEEGLPIVDSIPPGVADTIPADATEATPRRVSALAACCRRSATNGSTEIAGVPAGKTIRT